jgi:hypothetical protein
MNPNDLIAQQQALLNQAMQNAQHWTVAIITFQIAFLLIGAWVTFMFYARLRDIADELRKFRIAFEMAEDRKARIATPKSPRADEDSRFMPKS